MIATFEDTFPRKTSLMNMSLLVNNEHACYISYGACLVQLDLGGKLLSFKKFFLKLVKNIFQNKIIQTRIKYLYNK